MTTKKIKTVRKEQDYRGIKLTQSADVAAAKKIDPFWQHKTADQLAIEQDIKPIKDQKDFTKRIGGGLEEWDDIDEFLGEVHKPWK